MKKQPIELERGAYKAPLTSVYLLRQECNFCNTGDATLTKIEEDPDEIIWEDDD
ncbi:MAG: hypothetical protein II630_05040 [Bacteroidales bacterium]|nr:hypothetical protein [Bacteroidales bacterium]